jgi:hypothetical protein
MHFTELVFEGVRSFAGMHRFPLGKGFSVFVGGSGAGKTTVIDVLLHMLYPQSAELAANLFKSPSSSQCRAALLLDGEAKGKYRLVQDLASGAIMLSRQDPGSSNFVQVSNRPDEISQFITSQLQLPHKDIFSEIFITSGKSLPSVTPVASAGPAPSASVSIPAAAGAGISEQGSKGVGFPGYQGPGDFDDLAPDNPDEIRSQIEILTRDLTLAREVDDQQFKLDGLQSQMFELEQKIKGVKEASKKAESYEAKLKEYEKLAELPADFEKRVRAFERGKEKLKRDLERLDEDKERWEKRARESAPLPLVQNRIFLLSLLLGFLALGIGVAGFYINEYLRYVALLNIVGFGVATVVSIRHIDLMVLASRSEKRLELIDERRDKLETDFSLESSIVKRTMDEVEIESPRTIIEKYNERNKIQKEYDKLKEQLEKQLQDPEYIKIETSRKQLANEIAEIEEKLASAGGLMMSPNEMERRLQSLQAKLDQTNSVSQPQAGSTSGGFDMMAELGVGAPPGGASFDTGGQELQPSTAFAEASPVPKAPQGPNACQVLLKQTQDLFFTDVASIGQQIATRCSQYIAALTGQEYSQVVFDEAGSVECVQAATGATIGFSQLPVAIQDIVYIGIKFSILEAYCRQRSVPVFLDDPFKGVPQAMHELLGRMLAVIGKSTQVVLLTEQPSMARHAAASFKLNS